MANEQRFTDCGADETSRERGLRYYETGRHEEAAQAFAESVAERETSEGWNDWAAAELTAGHHKAEKGFRRALVLDPHNREAAANLGAFLASAGRHAEAIPYIEAALENANGQERMQLTQLRTACRAKIPAGNWLTKSQEAFHKLFAEEVGESPHDKTLTVRVPSDGSEAAVAQLKQEVASVDWYHKIDLGHGIVTPGCQDSRRELAMLQIPERLDGLTVLDIGAWDGFLSFEAERRGAKRVLATDGFAWKDKFPRTSKKSFDMACRALGSRVESLTMDILEISAAQIGRFDLVLMDALYGLRHPLAAFDHAHGVTKGRLILRTHVDLIESEQPAVAFYPHAEFAEGASNWWSPNPPAVIEMLHAVGFRKVTPVAMKRRDSPDVEERHKSAYAIFHAEA